MTALEALRNAEAALTAAGDVEARIHAEWLVADRLGVGRFDVYREGGRILTRADTERIAADAARMAGGEPLAYVLGWTDFRGLRLRCDARALIPRPETEELVQAVLDDRELWSRPAPRIADVGTGTGCIILSLAAERPDARLSATDLSREALALATENADRLGLRAAVVFRAADLLDGYEPASLDAVVSNPPYIASAIVDGLAPSVRDHEPRLALDGGADGMDAIRRLTRQAEGALAPQGRLFLETGFDQRPAVLAYLRARGWNEVEVRKDLAGHDRIVRALRPDAG